MWTEKPLSPHQMSKHNFNRLNQLLDRSRTQPRTAHTKHSKPRTKHQLIVQFNTEQREFIFRRFAGQLSLEETSGDYLVPSSLLLREIKKLCRVDKRTWRFLQNTSLKQLLSQEERRTGRPSVWKWHYISNDQLSDLNCLCFVLPIKKNHTTRENFK